MKAAVLKEIGKTEGAIIADRKKGAVPSERR
jgi:hypothetical protein